MREKSTLVLVSSPRMLSYATCDRHFEAGDVFVRHSGTKRVMLNIPSMIPLRDLKGRRSFSPYFSCSAHYPLHSS